jgi:hypothetical protein
MNLTGLVEIGLALLLLVVAVLLVFAYLRYKAAQSERRLAEMLRRVGLDPDILENEDTAAVVSAIRRRCRRCQTEDVCERWLAGEVEGGNTFCPNRTVFEELTKRSRLA